MKWAKVIDHSRCIGCHACTTACKSENLVPLSVTRTYVKYVDVGEFPQTRRAFQVTRCNQCDDAPCTHACPTRAMFRRPDGIVDFDKSICIGCKACIAACPYDAIFINPEDHSAEKCNFCAHRVDIGLEPACVVVCPTEAILIGDLDDPLAKVTQIVNRDVVNVRRPEKETHPKLFYKGAHAATLDPIAARRPDGGLFVWSEQGIGNRESGIGNTQVVSGHPREWNNAAAAVLSYDVPHRMPWDWRVSAYTWTKAISAGAYLVAWLMVMTGSISWNDPLWTIAAPLISLVFLGITGLLLIWDLEHPLRFYMIFTRPHWRSWLVKGAFIIGAYGVLLAVQLVAGAADLRGLVGMLAWIGVPLAAATAAYTAYLFAQSKARDLWQNPLLAPQMLVQAVLAGGALLLLAAGRTGDGALSWSVTIASGITLLFILFETTMVHVTAHSRLAVWEMTRGRYAAYFGFGVAGLALGLFSAMLSIAAIPALIGLLLYEHAYVQAGQAVPLA
jgi:Fe-S-cluster-containing dehydrogenase component/formate-dependent nitrite reductase membrane component NrfD